VCNEFLAVSAKLKRREDGLRWTTAESWHITLQFLGNTSQEQHRCVVARLREVQSQAVSVRLEGPDVFGCAGVFFVGVVLTPELLALERKVTQATANCGFAPETRPYRPHITLARSKGEGREKALRALMARIERQPSFSSFIADDFLLYESFLESEGARYEIRERFRLIQP
jgi:2'-5' RNA ligase